MDDDHTPSLTPSLQHVFEVADRQRTWRERDEEDERIDKRADLRITAYAATCPAVRGYHRLMGAIGVVGFVLLAALGAGWVMLKSTIELQGQRTREAIRQDVAGMVQVEVDRRWYASIGKNSSRVGNQ